MNEEREVLEHITDNQKKLVEFIAATANENNEGDVNAVIDEIFNDPKNRSELQSFLLGFVVGMSGCNKFRDNQKQFEAALLRGSISSDCIKSTEDLLDLYTKSIMSTYESIKSFHEYKKNKVVN